MVRLFNHLPGASNNFSYSNREIFARTHVYLYGIKAGAQEKKEIRRDQFNGLGFFVRIQSKIGLQWWDVIPWNSLHPHNDFNWMIRRKLLPKSVTFFHPSLAWSLSLSLSLVCLFAVSRKIVAGKCFDWKSTEKNMIRFNMARNTRKIIISIRGQDLIMEMALHVILNYACKCVTIGCRRRCCCWFATVLPFALFVLCVCVSLSLIVRLFICRRRIVWRVRRANVISNIWQTRKRHTKKCSLLWCI